MADIAAQLVSVERLLWSGRATQVLAETTEGAIGVMPRHQPMLGQLVDNGIVRIYLPDGTIKTAACQGGFLSVAPDKITILAEYATWSDEIDADSAREEAEDSDPVVKARGKAKMKAMELSSQ